MPKKPAPLAKLTRPRLYKAVARERLFRLLDEKREHPVVWIVGPPGAGKTTLVASYLDEAGVPAIWYQIDPGDSDPATFFYYLKQAIDSLTPGKLEPLPLLTQEYLADVPAFARRFFRIAFARLPDDFAFVFDNYHEIADDSTLHSALAPALKEIPAGANILVATRANPPPNFAELLVNQRLVQVGWHDLKLSQEEVNAIAASRGITDSAVLSALLDRSSGWMAGVALMLDRLRDGEKLDNLNRSDAWESVFDYFAGLIFDGAEAEMRHALMKTAFLPWVDSSLAEAVTGSKHAIKFPEALHRRHLFTDRRSGDETTFQYHALFRTFLKRKAIEVFSEHERHAIAIHAACEFRARGRAEEAFSLFLEAQDWTAVENLILANAQGLVAQGRWRTLKQWVESLPAARVESNPWVGYWAGRSITFVDPAFARRALQSVYQRFVESADPVGQLLSATTILEGIYFEFENLRQLDPWIEVVVNLLQRGVRGATKEDDLRANSVVMMGATFRTPVHSMLEACLNRVLDLLNESFEPNLKVAAASMLHGYANVAMDAQVERMASRIARPILNSKELSPQRAVFYWNAEGYSHYLRGRYEQAFACFDEANDIRRQLGVDDGNSVVVDIRRGLCERRAGLLDEAEESIRRVENSSVPLRGHHHAIFTLLRGVVAFDRGNARHAIETILRSYQAYEESGFFNGVVTTGTVAANVAIAGGRFDIASQILHRLRNENYGSIAQNYLAAIIFNQSWLAHRQGSKTQRNELLRDALQRAHDDGARIRFHWYRNAMQELLPVALSEHIEVDLALSIAREFTVVPEPLDIEVWPWPVKIYVLGNFELLIRGQQPEYSRKVPKKVLALLKSIIAFGGQNIPEQKILDALWPDEEGDGARRALTATLHRLRKLLENGDAILQAGSKLTLNERCCWIDAMSFERRLESGDWSEQACGSAVSLYRGAFLAQEEEAPWAVPSRERLRAKFIQAVGKQGTRAEKAGRYQEAIELYMRGIEADGLVESFYQGLMRSYEKLDRRSEAASAYRRLRQTLSVTLGVLPSTESQRLFASLQAE